MKGNTVVNTVKLLNVALVLVCFTTGTSLAADAISLTASEPAIIYYTTNGADPVATSTTTTTPAAGGSPSDDIKKAARHEVKFHLKDARIDQGYRHMGFESQDDIDNAAPGDGFQIFTIDIRFKTSWDGYNGVSFPLDDIPLNGIR